MILSLVRELRKLNFFTPNREYHVMMMVIEKCTWKKVFYTDRVHGKDSGWTLKRFDEWTMPDERRHLLPLCRIKLREWSVEGASGGCACCFPSSAILRSPLRSENPPKCSRIIAASPCDFSGPERGAPPREVLLMSVRRTMEKPWRIRRIKRTALAWRTATRISSHWWVISEPTLFTRKTHIVAHICFNVCDLKNRDGRMETEASEDGSASCPMNV